MSKFRRKTVAPKRKAAAKRSGAVRDRNRPGGWFYKAVKLPYRLSPQVEEAIKDAVDRLYA